MRITNNIIRENALTNMRRGLQQMESAQHRLGTGLRIRKASDDPAGTATALSTRGSIRALEQHRRSIDVANLRTTTEETALGQLTDLLDRAKEIGISQATATANPATRRAAAGEVEGLLRAAVSIGNTQLGDDYLFGGMNADVRPYGIDDTGATLDFTSTDPTGSLDVEIASNTYLATTHSGVEVLGTDTAGVLASLRDLAASLHNNDLPGIAAGLSSVDAAFENVQSRLAETGARFDELQITQANLDAVEINLLTLKSDLEELDVEEAATELMSRQTAYQAAMLATSRVMGLTLTDYLR